MKKLATSTGSGPRDPGVGERWLARVAERRGAVRPGSWFEAAVRWNLDRGAHPRIAERAEAVRRGEAVVVLTGQQVGLFGGPLLTLYKTLSAVALAEALEAAGVPALPVFWIVGDDSDFGEVSGAWFPSPDGRLQRVRDEDVPPGGTLTGRLPAARQARLLPQVAEAIGGHLHGGAVLRRLESALSRADDGSALHAACLHELLGEHGVLCLDGGAEDLLRAAGTFLREAAAAPLGDLLESGARRIGGQGLEPPLDRSVGDRALFRVRDGLREPLDGAPAADDLLAPNVVLRPLLQDHLLPNAATVCGPSEILYRAQLSPLYERLGVPEPLRPARFSAVLLPPLEPSGETAGGLGAARYEAAADEPRAFVDQEVERELPRPLYAEVEALRAQVRASIERLEPALAAFDKSLPQLVGSAAGKADYQFERMLEGIRGKQRHRLFRERPLLAALEDFVTPRQRPQERVLSAWSPFAIEGWEALPPLLEAAREEALPSVRTALEAESLRPGTERRRALFRFDRWEVGG